MTSMDEPFNVPLEKSPTKAGQPRVAAEFQLSRCGNGETANRKNPNAHTKELLLLPINATLEHMWNLEASLLEECAEETSRNTYLLMDKGRLSTRRREVANPTQRNATERSVALGISGQRSEDDLLSSILLLLCLNPYLWMRSNPR